MHWWSVRTFLFINNFFLYLLDNSYIFLSPKRWHGAHSNSYLILSGAQKLLEHLHKKGVPIAVATSSSQEIVTMKMQNHKKISVLFHHITMGSSDPAVTKKKPDPAIFLVCASQFQPKKPKPEKVQTGLLKKNLKIVLYAKQMSNHIFYWLPVFSIWWCSEWNKGGAGS